MGAHEKEEAEVVRNVLAGLHKPDVVQFSAERFHGPRVREPGQDEGDRGKDIDGDTSSSNKSGV